MVPCGHRKLKSKTSELRAQSREDACSMLWLGLPLGSCEAGDHTFTGPSVKRSQRIILPFPQSGISAPVNWKNHIETGSVSISGALG